MSEPAARPQPSYTFNEFTLDLERGCLRRGGQEVKLRPKVFEALKYLLLNNDRLVTKEELIKAVWTESFVTDDSLVQCLVELRRALGDEAQACLKTVPRRGYIFIAPVVEGDPGARPAAPSPRRSRERARRTTIALAAAAAAALATSYFAQPRRPAPGVAFTEKDSVLIADFDNRTGDEVFDGTLRQAMAVQLGQSPYVDVFPDERVRETLRYTGRSRDERVAPRLAREIAQRHGVKAVLAGSISTLGRHYVISLEVVNAATGEAMVRDQVEAESREKVLTRLGEAAARLRERLGESLASIERFAAPIEQATTPSLDAFKAYDLGRRRQVSGQYLEAIPLYRRAVELDPNFAIAYAALGLAYVNAREYDLGAQASRRAFELRTRVSERERFYISNRYSMDVLNDGDKAIEVLETWKQTYPHDFVPRTNLAVRYMAIGQHERGLEEAREGVRLNPDAAVAYASLIQAYMNLGRYAEARSAVELAEARKLEPPFSQYMRYGIGLLQGDAAAMQRQVQRAAGTTVESGMSAVQSATAAYLGQARNARGLTTRAMDLALARRMKEEAGLYSAGDALWEAAYGECGRARRTVARTLALTRGRRVVSWSALALAMCGESRQAQELAGGMATRFPDDSFLKASWLPMVRAAIELRGGHPARALDVLRAAGRVELGNDASLWPAYLRGVAYLDHGDARDAMAEFQKILDHKGVLAPKDFNPVAITLYPLAWLGRARAASRAGDLQESRKAYEALFALWKEADPDLPALVAARREYSRLASARAGLARPH